MANPYLGQLKLVAFSFAPKGWAMCDGQLLPINQNQALFSLLGTQFGGNGTTNFALPDLRGRVPAHIGSGYFTSVGVAGGTEQVTLSTAEIPSHQHGTGVSKGDATTGTPTGAYPAMAPDALGFVYNEVANASGVLLEPSGGGQPHENRQPSLTLNYIIALQGIFPSRD